MIPMNTKTTSTPVAYAFPDSSTEGAIATSHRRSNRTNTTTSTTGQLSASRQLQHFSLPPIPSQSAVTKKLVEERIDQLREIGYTSGLANALVNNTNMFPLRIFLIDNSGSMAAADGLRLVDSRTGVKGVRCTRWEEMQEAVECHAKMSCVLEASTVFRMLNDPGAQIGPQQFGVCTNGAIITQQQQQQQQQYQPNNHHQHTKTELDTVQTIMRKAAPSGSTPLARHVREIRDEIVKMTPQLIEDGRKVVLILATDGLPTNDYGGGDGGSEYDLYDFTEAMKSLEDLPVWIVIRLCTDEESVVEFYNRIDCELERNVEVLDDFSTEAHEVYKFNPWLNYAQPLHRCREIGFHHRLMDLIDERALTKGELKEFCTLLFGRGPLDGVPDPASDFRGFVRSIGRIASVEDPQWNPITGKVSPWIDIKSMKKKYGKSRFF